MLPECDNKYNSLDCKSSEPLVKGHVKYLGALGCEVHEEGLFQGWIPERFADATS
ncbi:hypothetical protein LCGC14_2029640 [marine sediment metagenome]|uniref:Uncharacterized protein n=1 Tax=marine sediment metagenome TaxID=412755 RepID=A0A0F9H8F6_9ZZZZ